MPPDQREGDGGTTPVSQHRRYTRWSLDTPGRMRRCGQSFSGPRPSSQRRYQLFNHFKMHGCLPYEVVVHT